MMLPVSLLMLVHPRAAAIAGEAIATAFATVALMTEAIRTAKRGWPIFQLLWAYLWDHRALAEPIARRSARLRVATHRPQTQAARLKQTWRTPTDNAGRV